VVPLPATAGTPAALRLLANGRQSIQRTSLPAASAGNAQAAASPARLSQTTGSTVRLDWDAAAYSMALVRDPATGQVLAIARGGRTDIATRNRDLDVTFSDGVRSMRQLVKVAP